MLPCSCSVLPNGDVCMVLVAAAAGHSCPDVRGGVGWGGGIHVLFLIMATCGE